MHRFVLAEVKGRVSGLVGKHLLEVQTLSVDLMPHFCQLILVQYVEVVFNFLAHDRITTFLLPMHFDR